MSLIILLGFLGVTGPQTSPAPLIHYLPAQSGETQSRFVCGEQEVLFRVRVDDDRVSILSYSGAAGQASAEQLARWNTWLAPMRRMVAQRFVCRGNSENLEIQGTRTQIDGPVSVSAYWHEGQLARYPDPYEMQVGRE